MSRKEDFLSVCWVDMVRDLGLPHQCESLGVIIDPTLVKRLPNADFDRVQ